MRPSTRTVASGGIELAVQEGGNPEQPTIVLLHGFPDTHAMWGYVVTLLEPDFHVVTYDVRGAGASLAPPSRGGYAMACLLDDLVAVLDAVCPDGVAHLVGHDWGAAQLWAAVLTERTDDRLHGRIGSFTSISCPPAEQFASFARRSVRGRHWKTLARQLGRSWYIGAFQVPVLPELVFRRFGGSLRRSLARTQRLGSDAHWGPTFATDGANGVNLYRANLIKAPAPGGAPAPTHVPVQLIVPKHDAFLTPALYDGLEDRVLTLQRVDVDAGHWVPRTHPELVATVVAGLVRSVERP